MRSLTLRFIVLLIFSSNIFAGSAIAAPEHIQRWNEITLRVNQLIRNRMINPKLRMYVVQESFCLYYEETGSRSHLDGYINHALKKYNDKFTPQLEDHVGQLKVTSLSELAARSPRFIQRNAKRIGNILSEEERQIRSAIRNGRPIDADRIIRSDDLPPEVVETIRANNREMISAEETGNPSVIERAINASKSRKSYAVEKLKATEEYDEIFGSAEEWSSRLSQAEAVEVVGEFEGMRILGSGGVRGVRGGKGSGFGRPVRASNRLRRGGGNVGNSALCFFTMIASFYVEKLKLEGERDDKSMEYRSDILTIESIMSQCYGHEHVMNILRGEIGRINKERDEFDHPRPLTSVLTKELWLKISEVLCCFLAVFVTSGFLIILYDKLYRSAKRIVVKKTVYLAHAFIIFTFKVRALLPKAH